MKVDTDTGDVGFTHSDFGPLYTLDQPSSYQHNIEEKGYSQNLHSSYLQMSKLPWCNPLLAHLPQCVEATETYPYKSDMPGTPFEGNKLGDSA